MSEHIIILGAGPAGYVAALEASDLGARVTLVGAEDVGGTCLHRGCIPTKTLVASCKVLTQARRSQEYGISLDGSIRPDWNALQARMGKVVRTNVSGVSGLLRNRAVETVEGRGRLVDDGGGTLRVEVAGRVLDPGRILLCTGSRPVIPPMFQLDGERQSCSDDLLAWSALPRSLVIVGGGVIASELAFIFRSLDVDVTVVEMADRPLPQEDPEVSRVIAREMKKRRIRFIGGVAVDAVGDDGDQIVLHSRGGEVARAERVLVAVGRAPDTTGLGLEAAGLRPAGRGQVSVDEFMQTASPGLYAAGDLTGQCMLAHAASAQARVAVRHMLGRATDPYVDAHVPRVTFTDPEVASIGLTEAAARERHGDAMVGRFDLRALGKAHALGEIGGLVKLIGHPRTGELLGAHIVGAHAGELIHEPAALLARGCGLEAISGTVHAHPTLAEALQEAAEDALGGALHKPRGTREKEASHGEQVGDIVS